MSRSTRATVVVFLFLLASATLVFGEGGESVTFANGTVTLKGTLFSPVGPGRHPAVIAYHAANGGERNFPFYQHLTTDLPAAGIAVLLFDRRGSGESSGDFESSDFATLAADGIAGIQFLKQRKDIDAARIGVWGVSQGGWIAPLAATMSKDIKFVVIVSGCGVTPSEQMTYGAAFALNEAKYPAPVIERARHLRAKLDAYYRGKASADSVGPDIEKARTEPWFDLVYLPGGGHLPPDPKQTKWFLEMDFDPLPTLSKVRVPVLAFFGETDRWVPIDRSVEKIKQANERVEIHRIAGADHLMATQNSTGPVADEYRRILVRWLKKHTSQ